MPALNFQARFVLAIHNGLDEVARRPPRHPEVRPKRQTIRALRKDGRDPRPGQMLYLYTDMRRKTCRFLGMVTCREALPIYLGHELAVVEVDGQALGPFAVQRLAQADGFRDAIEMWGFFAPRLPLRGWVIRW